MLQPPRRQRGTSAEQSPTFTFIPRPRLRSQTLAQQLDSLVRVSRRVNETHIIASRAAAATTKMSLGIRGSCKQSHTYHPKASLWQPQQYPLHRTPGMPARARYNHTVPKQKPRGNARAPTNWRTAGPIDFIASFWQFQVLLTLFSKFFSPFPRGTCVLSVFHGYLALDGIYHPLRLHSQAIRLLESLPYEAGSKSDTGLSPSLAPHSSGLGPGPHSGETSISYNSHPIKSNKITSLSSTSFTRRY
jgi:hypothetical protein